jgi:hypothetical protein
MSYWLSSLQDVLACDHPHFREKILIISDRHQFVFVHIPKCAGTTIRKTLQHVDDRNGFYTRRVEQHAELGMLDYVHIPLFVLREYFQKDFELLKDYWSFAVVRDPFARFPSSIAQRFRMNGDQPIYNQGIADIRAEIDQTIDFLSKQPEGTHLLPAEYIHFQKQVDYIFLDEHQVMDAVYTVNEIDALLADLGERIGHDLIDGKTGKGGRKDNPTLVHRNEITRYLVKGIRPVAKYVYRALPLGARQKIRSRILVPPDRRLQSFFSSNYVQDFIRDYYCKDLEFWEEKNSG